MQAVGLHQHYVPILQQVLGFLPSPCPPPPLLSPPPVMSQSQLEPASPLPGPSPYSGPTRGLSERREPESCPVSPESRSASPVHTVRAGRVLRPRSPPVPGTHSMTLRPSTAPQRVPLPSPPASSLPAGPDPASYSLCAASPAVTRFLATAVTDPLFESTAASALVTELVHFAAAYRLDYAASLVAESASASVCPPSVGGECALGTDVLEDRQEEFECFAATVPHLVSMLLALEGDPDAPDIPTPRSYAEAIEGPYSSQWQAAMDAEMASWKSTGTYVDEVPPPGANIVTGMWIFRVKRPPGSPPAFKARYVARGFSQRQGVDFFLNFSPTPKMTTLRVLLHVAAQRDYELHSLDFSTTFLQGSLHEEIWLCRPPGFTGSFLADDLVFATADIEALAHVKSELQKRHTCTYLAAPPGRAAPPSQAAPPCRAALPYATTATPVAIAASTATLATAPTAAMASPTVLTFDAEGRAVDFDVWVDDRQLFLQCDSRDGVSLFDHTSSVSTAPAATADSRPLSLYDAVVARYSSPATAALSRLMLPYLFPALAAFARVADLVAHLRTSDARYRAALPTEFCAKNPPPPCTSPFTT
ncbi:unnamed protein product [Closterium sp. NIES-54]